MYSRTNDLERAALSDERVNDVLRHTAARLRLKRHTIANDLRETMHSFASLHVTCSSLSPARYPIVRTEATVDR